MRRDSIFYRIFSQDPTLLFTLLADPPPNATQYQFDSVAVKEPRFEIDGVFLPPETDSPGIVYFCEVQFQTDEKLYERVFAELFLYFYRNRPRFSDWKAVIIYPSRSIEQSTTQPYDDLLNSNRIYRIYLDELGDIQQLPLGLGLMVLTTLPESQAPDAARYLLQQAKQESAEAAHGIIELVTTIITYKFIHMSRVEIEAMLDIRLQDTRVFQEAKQEGIEQGIERGIERGERAVLLRLLNSKFGTLSAATLTRFQNLSLQQLDALSDALLDFHQIQDLQTWLEQEAP